MRSDGDWPDYLQYGFDAADVPNLLKLVCDQSLHTAGEGTDELWVPIHAWRTLGQLRARGAVATMIASFDHIPYSARSLGELGTVLGMIGEPAIDPLSLYMKENRRPEFARALAFDGLAKVARNYPECRRRVLRNFKGYMAGAGSSSTSLNGFLVGKLLDLEAAELIDDIRRLFETSSVERTCAGGVEKIEIELGLRGKHAPGGSGDTGSCRYAARAIAARDELIARVDDYLHRYGKDDSVKNAGELDGLFAALACAPALIRTSLWMSAIWGDKDSAPVWQSRDEAKEFKQIVKVLHNAVVAGFGKNEYLPLFHESKVAGKTHTVVDAWCAGFLRGAALWGLLSGADRLIVEKFLATVRLFATAEGFEKLRSMDGGAIAREQAKIEPVVNDLYRHFRKQGKQYYDSLVNKTPSKHQV